jgi:hypothetical protein
MMLKKALTVGATAILAILASAGVASAAEVNASQIIPLPPIASPAEPESSTLPEPDEDETESTSDTESPSLPGSDSTPDESDSTTDEPGSTTDGSDATTDPEDELEPVETDPAPAEEAPASDPLSMIQSFVSSLFG